MLPEHLRDLVATHLSVIALAEAGPTVADLTNAPYLDHWIAVREFTGRIVLSGDVTGHPLLHNTGIVTSQQFGIDAACFSCWRAVILRHRGQAWWCPTI